MSYEIKYPIDFFLPAYYLFMAKIINIRLIVTISLAGMRSNSSSFPLNIFFFLPYPLRLSFSVFKVQIKANISHCYYMNIVSYQRNKSSAAHLYTDYYC